MSHYVHTRVIAVTLVLAVTACGDSGQGTETNTPDLTSTTTSDTTSVPTSGTTAASDDSTTGAPACVEDDLMASMFAGPGYDPANGGLQEPLQDEYVASSTLLALRPETVQDFIASVTAMIPVLMANPGLVGFSTAQSAKCGTARTLTVWRDEMAMMTFVTSDEHVAGMAKAGEYSTTGTVTSWKVKRADVPIPWETAMARIEASTPSY